MLRFNLLAVILALVAGCTQDSPVKKAEEKPVKGEEKQTTSQNKIMKDEVEPVVRVVVAERLRIKPESLDMKKPIADELDVVQVVMTLEERFMFDIPDAVIEKHSKAKLGEPACKLSPSQLVGIVEESRMLAAKKR